MEGLFGVVQLFLTKITLFLGMVKFYAIIQDKKKSLGGVV